LLLFAPVLMGWTVSIVATKKAINVQMYNCGIWLKICQQERR